MIISQQRLTLFAIISAIEADARQLIAGAILPNMEFSAAFPVDLLEECRQRMKKVAHLVADADSDVELLEFMNLGDHFQAMNRWKAFLSAPLVRVLAKSKTVETVVAIRNRVMHGRPLDFDDLPFIKGVSEELVRADHLGFAGTAALIKTLRRNPGHVFEFEGEFELEAKDTVLHNLPSPDFDDTGFVGRSDQLARLKSAIKGSFPIITILGDGGLGKTSLALKALYDLLDEPENQFDAIIWTTAKTTVLTADAIVEIEDSIKDSIGIFAAASAVLEPVSNQDPMGNLRRWLAAFKILLVIDNLETILDERIRRFAAEIPPGSKILFTTRVGLGAYDFPIEIHQLSEREGVDYYRRICDVYGLPELQEKKREFVLDTCTRLNFSPLAIKWFAQAIRAGGSPSALLADPKLVLRFCVANVVDGLSAGSRGVLDALIITGRPQTLSSLHYILSEELIVLSNSLRELRAANLITITPSQLLGGDDFYLVKPLANFYMRNYFSPSLERQKLLRQKQSQLSLAKDKLIAMRKGKPNQFDPNYIHIREEHAGSDFVVADYLSSALTELRKDNADRAEEHLAKAHNMSPNYFEVHRVEAFMAFVGENTLRAEGAYERAISLCGDYAPLRYLYAGFLLRIDEAERAVAQLEAAVLIDDNDPSIKVHLARAYIRCRNFEAGEKQLRKLKLEELSFKTRKILIENWFQFYLRRLESTVGQHDFDGAYETVKELKAYITHLDASLLDGKHRNAISRIPPLINRFIVEDRGSARSLVGNEALALVAGLLGVGSEVRPLPKERPIVEPTLAARQRVGTVKNTFPEKRFGFIREDNGSEWFFHKNHLREPSQFEDYESGLRVLFDVGKNEQGPCAVSIQAVSQ
ncbi:cold shock domain-containing protein [Tardiphaga sp. 42S5]|uniref:cold shock domain-containing protein n=1 Tax=Tardiphaga sp. 42S5 TaxID=1404799 RepID=UPI002A5A76F2|nr:cold shock domain-containing protein [Tardiphaga sp. 42S5]WPO42029.1 cold shock domain-containing protein [Tardiphaga sp. 42S5]